MIPNISPNAVQPRCTTNSGFATTWSCSLDSFANQLTIISAKSTPSINFFEPFVVFSFGMCLNTVPQSEPCFPHLSLLSPKFTFTQLSLQTEKAGGTQAEILAHHKLSGSVKVFITQTFLPGLALTFLLNIYTFSKNPNKSQDVHKHNNFIHIYHLQHKQQIIFLGAKTPNQIQNQTCFSLVSPLMLGHWSNTF